MERETGFEPATSTMARSHSTTELFPLGPETQYKRYHRRPSSFKASPIGSPAAMIQGPGRSAPNAFRINVTSGDSPAPPCTATTSKRQGRAAHRTRAM